MATDIVQAKAARLARDRGQGERLWRKFSELDPTIGVQVQGDTVTLRMDRITAERLAEKVAE